MGINTLIASLTERLSLHKGLVTAIFQWPLPNGHMFSVVVHTGSEDFVVWDVNSQTQDFSSDCGCSNGSYFTRNGYVGNESDALGEFVVRVQYRRKV